MPATEIVTERPAETAGGGKTQQLDRERERADTKEMPSFRVCLSRTRTIIVTSFQTILKSSVKKKI